MLRLGWICFNVQVVLNESVCLIKKGNRKCIYEVRQNAVNMKQHHESLYSYCIWIIKCLMIHNMIQGHRKSIVCVSFFNLIPALYHNTHVFMPSLYYTILSSSSVHALERTKWSINLLHLAESDAVLQSLKSLFYCSKLHQETALCGSKMI